MSDPEEDIDCENDWCRTCRQTLTDDGLCLCSDE